ncbi:YopX family protein [Viridibacillus arvi]|uniref:YopX family protein n=1 Tax=Viridibacillus arvi TaxID=263475 RepID=UPI003CFE581E
MREIKFRGRPIEKYGTNLLYGSVFLDFAEKIAYIESVSHRPIPVHFESVGEYTGLKDKNGREIYEGDILNCQDECHPFVKNWNGQVKMIDGGWFCEIGENKIFIGYSEDEVEVIGNIYEHPHLLNEVTT